MVPILGSSPRGICLVSPNLPASPPSPMQVPAEKWAPVGMLERASQGAVPWDQPLSLATGQVDCAPGEVSCVDGTCLGAIQLCDGVWDCLDGADEGPGHCPLPSLPTPPAGTLPGPSAVSWETAPTPLASVGPGEPPGGKGIKKLASGGLGWRGQGLRGRPRGTWWGVGEGAGSRPASWRQRNEGGEGRED